jgi:SAM-dependent methyltransferase
MGMLFLRREPRSGGAWNPAMSATPPNHLALLRQFYNAPAAPMTRWSAGYRDLLAAAYNEMIPDDASVLEIGCGDGSLLALLKGREKAGIDLSETQIAAARARLPRGTFYVVEAESFRAERTYDVLIISDTLNQAGDCQRLLQQLQNAAHPGTRLMGNIFNSLWRPVMHWARQSGAAAEVPPENWLSRDDAVNFLNLSDWEPIRTFGKILLPIADSPVANFVNRWLAPCFPWFAWTLFVVARPGRQRMSEPSVSIVVPARNEADNVEGAIRRAPLLGAEQEWIFVEGGSTDDTWARIQKLPQLFPDRKIKFIQQTGQGKANAVREGFALASGKILMILDADLTMPPEELSKFHEAIVTGRAEFANGTRLVYPMENGAMPFLNLCANKFFAVLFTWLLDQPVKDTLCGTKVLTRTSYDRIAAGRAHFGDFDPFGDFDLLFGASRLNLKIADIPIRYRERTYGHTNISRWKHGAILLRMAVVGAAKLKFI